MKAMDQDLIDTTIQQIQEIAYKANEINPAHRPGEKAFWMLATKCDSDYITEALMYLYKNDRQSHDHFRQHVQVSFKLPFRRTLERLGYPRIVMTMRWYNNKVKCSSACLAHMSSFCVDHGGYFCLSTNAGLVWKDELKVGKEVIKMSTEIRAMESTEQRRKREGRKRKFDAMRADRGKKISHNYIKVYEALFKYLSKRIATPGFENHSYLVVPQELHHEMLSFGRSCHVDVVSYRDLLPVLREHRDGSAFIFMMSAYEREFYNMLNDTGRHEFMRFMEKGDTIFMKWTVGKLKKLTGDLLFDGKLDRANHSWGEPDQTMDDSNRMSRGRKRIPQQFVDDVEQYQTKSQREYCETVAQQSLARLPQTQRINAPDDAEKDSGKVAVEMDFTAIEKRVIEHRDGTFTCEDERLPLAAFNPNCTVTGRFKSGGNRNTIEDVRMQRLDTKTMKEDGFKFTTTELDERYAEGVANANDIDRANKGDKLAALFRKAPDLTHHLGLGPQTFGVLKGGNN